MSTEDYRYHVHSLSDIFEMYADVCEWFGSLGFHYAQTRYGTYKRVFEEFERFAGSGTLPDDLIAHKRSFDNAYIEANEIIRIHNDLKKIDSAEFLQQIKKVTSGQTFRAASNDDEARDFLFELSTAARFIRAGYRVSLTGICDVVAESSDDKLFIECKRIKSVNKLSANVKKANKQIVKRLEGDTSRKACGLAAVNITDLIPRPTILFPDSMTAATSLH